MANLTQPKGSVSTETNIQSIARVLNTSSTLVTYLSTDIVLSKYTAVYDNVNEKIWLVGNSTGTPTSWALDSTGEDLEIVTSTGSFSLEPFSTVSAAAFDDKIASDRNITIGDTNTTAGDVEIDFYPYGTTTPAGRFQWTSFNVCQLYGQNSLTVQSDFYANNILPTGTSYSIGSSSNIWNNIYTKNAVTVVSDMNYKTDINTLSSSEIELSKKLASLYRTYKLSSSSSTETHFGTIAQLVMQAFTDSGLNWADYSVVVYEKWEAVDEVKDNNGNVIIPAKEAGEIYMVRYEELNSLINAGQEARLLALENK